MRRLELEKGEFLVKLARKAIEEYLGSRKVIDPPEEEWLKEKRGVFTTLRTHPGNALRGCIGLPYPVFPLGKALIESAISAAVNDPRFYPVSLGEMDRIKIEVTVLTPPRELTCSPEDRPKHVILGKHGLIVERDGFSGLLLPQVPEEVGWETSEEFLDGTCAKAGLPPGCWKDPNTRVYVFEGEIFEEIEPRGRVIKVDNSQAD